MRFGFTSWSSSLFFSFAVVASAFGGTSGCADDRGGGSRDGDGGTVAPGTDGGIVPRTDGGTTMLSGHVDPACTDGRYHEDVPPTPSASLAGVTFSGDIAAFVDAVLMRRYAFGLEEVRGGRMNRGFPGDCSVTFAGGATSAEQVYSQLEVIVHECAHMNDLRMGGAGNAYVIQASQTLTCTQGDAVGRGGMTFARNLLNGDDYASRRPGCGSRPTATCDSYQSVYLNDDPNNGGQGFNMLMEEVVQYINSLATAYAIGDQLDGSRSARDGILTFLWYVERYLHLARTEHPDAYAFITGNACWRDLILTTWGRAWYYLELTRGMPGLGISDDAIEALVLDSTLLDEIQRIRNASGCPSR